MRTLSLIVIAITVTVAVGAATAVRKSSTPSTPVNDMDIICPNCSHDLAQQLGVN